LDVSANPESFLQRDRFLKDFWKNDNIDSLKEAEALSKKLKRKIKEVTRHRLQIKATSPDPKSFWSAMNGLLGKTQDKIELKIEVSNDNFTTDSNTIANSFADFFLDKADRLSKRTTPEEVEEVDIESDDALFLVTEEMVRSAIKQLKRKKSFGPDGIPLLLVRDSFPFLKTHYLKLMNLATKQMPAVWKTARVIPLHKKGSKTSMDNYRPISNLCGMDKLFERVP